MFTVDVYSSVEFYDMLKGTDRFSDLDSADYRYYMNIMPRGMDFVNVNELAIKIHYLKKEIDRVAPFTVNKQQMIEIDRIQSRIEFYKGLIQLIKSKEIPPRCIVTHNIHTKGWIPAENEYVEENKEENK